MSDNKCADCAELAVEAGRLELALDLIFKLLEAHVKVEHPKVASGGTGNVKA